MNGCGPFDGRVVVERLCGRPVDQLSDRDIDDAMHGLVDALYVLAHEQTARRSR